MLPMAAKLLVSVLLSAVIAEPVQFPIVYNLGLPKTGSTTLHACEDHLQTQSCLI